MELLITILLYLNRTQVQFVGEHGFGWGVTQGFYTAVALELQVRPRARNLLSFPWWARM